jgi:signal transduction histidine kinase
MQTLTGEIEIVIAVTVLLLVITIFVIVVVFISQQQHHKYLHEKEELTNMYQQEILQTQLEIKEQTLQNISQEIHDNIGQVLSLAKLNLSTLPAIEEPSVATKLTNTKELVSKAIQDLRNLSKTLDSDRVSEAGLYQALRFEMEQIEKTGAFTTRVQLKGTERQLEHPKEIIIFRIAQEALNNVIKHARAQTIIVTVTYLSQQFLLTITDDGIGFDVPALQQIEVYQKGSGLRNMYNRAKLIGGQLSIHSVPGQGTVTSLHLSLSQT